MLPDGTIAGKHLWKRFRADRRRSLLRDEVQRIGTRLRGETAKGWRWALRDVNVEIERGEAVGLVGLNGSGKSTLLKILARVMAPYAGRLEVRGRVGALIEVRAGIHPELSGRENIHLYGSLLGCERKRLLERFDEIVAFAELEESIERQVKFYSSGMQMRLGFAVAAFLEPDILLVDEVLAVGDATFQQRCLDRIRTLLEQHTTLVFVSHDLPAIESVCRRGIWLREGWVAADGPVGATLSEYRRSIEERAVAPASPEGPIRVLKADVSGETPSSVVGSDGPCRVELLVEAQEAATVGLCLGISEGTPMPVLAVRRNASLPAGESVVVCEFPYLPLPKGRFYVWLSVGQAKRGQVLPWQPIASFEVMGPSLQRLPPGIVRLSPVHVPAEWEVTSR